MRLWDTSAVLSLLLRQNATEELTAIFHADGSMVLWWGAKVEAVSAVSRLLRSSEIVEGVASRLLAQVDALTSAAYEVQPTEEVRVAACRILRVHELRAADALQLGAALVWAGYRPSGMGFVCLDRRLRDAAAKEGFDVSPAPDGSLD